MDDWETPVFDIYSAQRVRTFNDTYDDSAGFVAAGVR